MSRYVLYSVVWGKYFDVVQRNEVAVPVKVDSSVSTSRRYLLVGAAIGKTPLV